ncbi:MAG: Ig-like domain-containing protein, partial [Deltaproteobacteria bacterium]|nr:Ig-like domain-containing protein [Deltaproteobacteria bacterium]
QEITAQVTWASSDDTVATVSNADPTWGEATTISAGSTTISATSGSINGTATLEVTAATLVSIAVTPPDTSIAKGLTQQFTAIGTYTDTSTQDLTDAVTWSSLDTDAATISNATDNEGLATAVDVGTTTITAALDTINGSTDFTVSTADLVSIGVTPVNPSVAQGLQQQFTAIGTYTDNTTLDITTQVTWSTGNAAVVTIGPSTGLATTLSTGTDSRPPTPPSRRRRPYSSRP